MSYAAFSPKQKKVLSWWVPGNRDCKKEAIVCDGAVRSGKTMAMGLSFFLWAFACFDGQRFGVCGKTISSLRRNVLSEILPRLEGMGATWKEKRTENLVTVRFLGRENRFYIFGGRDESSASLIQGITFAGILLDEVALMPRSFVEQACARCSVAGSRLWFNCNPAGPSHWFYQTWILEAEKRNCLRLHFTMEDNPSLTKEIRERYDEPEVRIYGDDVDALGGNALTTQDTAKVIGLLCAAPNGVQSWSQDIEGLVQTSLNLGVVRLEEELKMTFAVRSSVNREKRELLDRLKAVAEEFGADYSEAGDYPAWEYRKDSPLRDTMVQVYRQMYGKQAQVVAIHAGLECGILSDKLPGLDCVSIGPNMLDIHTSRERLEIASTRRTWEFLLEILKKY